MTAIRKPEDLTQRAKDAERFEILLDALLDARDMLQAVEQRAQRAIIRATEELDCDGIAILRAGLLEVRQFCEGRAEATAEDGEGLTPNLEMQLCTLIDEALKRAGA